MTPRQAKTLAAAVRRLIKASIEDSWKGAGYPEDTPFIENDLKNVKFRFDNLLKSFTELPAAGTESPSQPSPGNRP